MTRGIKRQDSRLSIIYAREQLPSTYFSSIDTSRRDKLPIVHGPSLGWTAAMIMKRKYAVKELRSLSDIGRIHQKSIADCETRRKTDDERTSEEISPAHSIRIRKTRTWSARSRRKHIVHCVSASREQGVLNRTRYNFHNRRRIPRIYTTRNFLTTFNSANSSL